MSTIQQEILDKFRQLDAPAQRELLTLLGQVAQPPLTLAQNLERSAIILKQLDEKYGPDHFPDVQDTLDQIREEASWPQQ